MNTWPNVAALAVFLLAGLAALHIIAPHVDGAQLTVCAILLGLGAIVFGLGTLIVISGNIDASSEDEDA